MSSHLHLGRAGDPLYVGADEPEPRLIDDDYIRAVLASWFQRETQHRRERRFWLVVVVILAAYSFAAGHVSAAPRSEAVIPSASALAMTGETDQPQSGAPLDPTSVSAAATADVPPVGAPPTSGLGDWSTGTNVAYTAPPDRSGTATWWNSWGPGLYAALRPDLGTKGDLAIVCGGKPWRCISVAVTTTCACLGPGSDRLIDLSRDAFAMFADPSVGVIRIVLSVVKGGAP